MRLLSNTPNTMGMMTLRTTLLPALFISLFTSLFIVPVQGHDHAHGPAPVQFVTNKGQWDPAVLFRTGVVGAAVFLQQDGASWVKYEEGTSDRIHDIHTLSLQEQEEFTVRGHAWRMRFHNALPDASIEASGALTGYHNYFLGNDASNWTSRVPLHTEVRYRNVWTGIDVRYHSSEGHLKYDVLLAPGAEVASIGFRYEGVDGLTIDRDGKLVITTSVGDVLELAPIAFHTDGGREAIACRYWLDDGILRYELEAGHDTSRPITIDPLLIASTLSGSTGSDNYGHCATYDANGNIFTGARNFGPTYPVSVGAFQSVMGGGGTDISLSKYSPNGGALIWASYMGGNSGENPHSLVANSLGQLCVLGSTNSTNFPVTASAYDNTHNGATDMTVTVISVDGTTLIGSTFVGGAGADGYNSMFGNYGEAYRGEIICDAADNILIASCSSSADFPTSTGSFQGALAGGQDAVVLGLNPTVSTLQFSTFLGGTTNDTGMGIRMVDGQVVVCGHTESSNFPVGAGGYQSTFQGGATDAFVVKFNGTATSMLASTFFGTDAMDRGYFMDHDNDANIWIYGQTEGAIAIQPAGTYGAAGGSIYIAKLSPDLAAAPVTTVFGTGGWGSALAPVAFLVDVCDNVYISGYNAATALPTTPDALYTTGSFYLAAFEPDMAGLLFGTYYGGSHVDGGTSRFDKNGIVYQGVCSGFGSMQTTPWAYATNQTIGWDIGVFKIDFQVAGVNAAGASTLNQGCAPISIDFSNASTGDLWFWDFGDGTPIVTDYEPSHTYLSPGDYIVTLIAMDTLACNLADTTYLPITIGQQQPITASLEWEQVADCEQLQITAQNTSTGEPIDHIWDMGDGTTYDTDDILHTYTDPGDYEILLIAFDPTGCSDPDTVMIPITIAPLEFTFDVPDEVICRNSSVTLDASSIEGTYLWSTGSAAASINVSETGIYWVTISNAAGCIGTDSLEVTPAPDQDLAFKVTTCPGVTVPLTIPLADALEYHWDTGSTERTYDAPGEERTYDFWVIDAFGCPHTDTARVDLYDPDAYMFAPNAFTPDGDGINDVFRITGYGEDGARFMIYDRWGEKLYETTNPQIGWDGTYRGTPVKNDVYVYELNYRGICDNTLQKTIGHVTVVR